MGMLYGMLGTPFIFVMLALQVVCAVHCVRAGHARYWLWIILVFSGLGTLIYFIVEILPTLGQSSAVRKTNKAITGILDPDRDLRQKSASFAISNNVETTCHYAAQLVSKGKYDEAIAIYNDARKGLFQHDPVLLKGLGDAYLASGRHDDAAAVLKELLDHHPDHKSGDVHLCYAIALEAGNHTQQAEQEYRQLVQSYPGPEPKCRYARLLLSLGAEQEALALFREVELGAVNAPRHYQRLHQEWISMARQELKAAEQRAKAGKQAGA